MKDQAKNQTKNSGLSAFNFLMINEAIVANLNQDELLTYAKAIEAVHCSKILSKKELEVLDKLDIITMKQFGICLKDSLVTKARIDACHKHGIKFVDRDGLVEHMNNFLPKGVIAMT